jgi:hypothetical protein
MSKEVNNKYRFIYKRDKPTSLKVMGIVAALFSLVGLSYTPVFSVVMALAAAGLFLYQSGIEIDFNLGQYRLITAFGSLGFGNWEAIPALKCVSVFKTKFSSRTYGRSNASVTTSEQVIQVNLVTERNKRVLLFESEDMHQAFGFAQKVGAKLNQKVWDATEKEGKWLD